MSRPDLDTFRPIHDMCLIVFALARFRHNPRKRRTTFGDNVDHGTSDAVHTALEILIRVARLPGDSVTWETKVLCVLTMQRFQTTRFSNAVARHRELGQSRAAIQAVKDGRLLASRAVDVWKTHDRVEKFSRFFSRLIYAAAVGDGLLDELDFLAHSLRENPYLRRLDGLSSSNPIRLGGPHEIPGRPDGQGAADALDDTSLNAPNLPWPFEEGAALNGKAEQINYADRDQVRLLQRPHSAGRADTAWQFLQRVAAKLRTREGANNNAATNTAGNNGANDDGETPPNEEQLRNSAFNVRKFDDRPLTHVIHIHFDPRQTEVAGILPDRHVMRINEVRPEAKGNGRAQEQQQSIHTQENSGTRDGRSKDTEARRTMSSEPTRRNTIREQEGRTGYTAHVIVQEHPSGSAPSSTGDNQPSSTENSSSQEGTEAQSEMARNGLNSQQRNDGPNENQSDGTSVIRDAPEENNGEPNVTVPTANPGDGHAFLMADEVDSIQHAEIEPHNSENVHDISSQTPRLVSFNTEDIREEIMRRVLAELNSIPLEGQSGTMDISPLYRRISQQVFLERRIDIGEEMPDEEDRGQIESSDPRPFRSTARSSPKSPPGISTQVRANGDLGVEFHPEPPQGNPSSHRVPSADRNGSCSQPAVDSNEYTSHRPWTKLVAIMSFEEPVLLDKVLVYAEKHLARKKGKLSRKGLIEGLPSHENCAKMGVIKQRLHGMQTDPNGARRSLPEVFRTGSLFYLAATFGVAIAAAANNWGKRSSWFSKASDFLSVVTIFWVSVFGFAKLIIDDADVLRNLVFGRRVYRSAEAVYGYLGDEVDVKIAVATEPDVVPWADQKDMIFARAELNGKIELRGGLTAEQLHRAGWVFGNEVAYDLLNGRSYRTKVKNGRVHMDKSQSYGLPKTSDIVLHHFQEAVFTGKTKIKEDQPNEAEAESD